MSRRDTGRHGPTLRTTSRNDPAPGRGGAHGQQARRRGQANSGGGQRAWRSALYSPGGRYSLYRVVFKEEVAEAWTGRLGLLVGSRAVIDGARTSGVKSAARLADIRQDMAAMRKLAWREGWLPRDVDPLEGLALP